MTKAELIARLADLPDDAQVLIKSWPSETDESGPGIDDLFAVRSVWIVESEGPGYPAFAVVDADVAFQDNDDNPYTSH